MDQLQKTDRHYAPSRTQRLAGVSEITGQCLMPPSGPAARQNGRAHFDHSAASDRGQGDYYRWILGGVASLLMCVSAVGQSGNTPISISGQGKANPYPSPIRLGPNLLLGATFRVAVVLPW